MGNSYCCNRVDVYSVLLEKKNYIEINNIIVEAQELELIKSTEKIIKLQNNWRGYKVRSKYLKIKEETKFNFAKIPGLELSLNQIINKSTPLMEETEKKLGPFETKRNSSKGSNKNTLSDNKNSKIYNIHLKNTSILYQDNTIYTGSFNLKWEKHGFGTLFTKENAKICGFFKEDKLNGQGRIIYPEGDYFEGNFIDDKICGYGEYVNPEGVKYKGEWKDDMKNGYGEEIHSDGTIFTGEFVDDLKHGKGKFIWPDKTIYEGGIVKNQIEGIGKMIFPARQFYKGEWKSNKIEGRGIFIWPDKKVYIGNYKNEKKWGFGIFIWPNGRRYEGQWLNGKQHGFGICYHNNKKQLSEWRLGKRQKMAHDSIDDMKNKIIQINTNILELIAFFRTLDLDIDDSYSYIKIEDIQIIYELSAPPTNIVRISNKHT